MGTKNAQSIASTEYSDKELILNINCPNPEKVLRWADLFYDDLVSLQTFYGSISTGQIKDNGDGTYELLTPKDNTLDTSAWWYSPRDFGPKYMRKEFEEKVTLPTDQGDGSSWSKTSSTRSTPTTRICCTLGRVRLSSPMTKSTREPP